MSIAEEFSQCFDRDTCGNKQWANMISSVYVLGMKLAIFKIGKSGIAF
jgi:hypothetical protein